MNGTWQTVDLAGKPAAVYTPPQRPRFGVLYLHTYGLETLEGNPAFTRPFDELRLACVCPHGVRSWWADRVCSEFDPVLSAERHLLTHVLPYFESTWSLKPPAVGLLGISMGGQGALRLAFEQPRTFPVVAAIASAI